MLDQSPSTYTEILNGLGIEKGLLNYHLDGLKELITKREDGKYVLSEFGEASLALTKRIEEPVKKESRELKLLGRWVKPTYAKGIMTILLVTTLATSGLYINLYNNFTEQKTAFQEELKELESLTAKFDEFEYYELWHGEPDIRDAQPNYGWWFTENHGTGKMYGGCKSAADTINYLLQNNKSDFLEYVFVQMFIDMYNDSIYVVLTKTDDVTTSKFLELMHPSPYTTVHFIKGPAPRDKLEEWMNQINSHWDELWEKGVYLWSASICTNGTILLGIEEVTHENVEIILDTLKGEVPPGILIIRKEGPIELS